MCRVHIHTKGDCTLSVVVVVLIFSYCHLKVFGNQFFCNICRGIIGCVFISLKLQSRNQPHCNQPVPVTFHDSDTEGIKGDITSFYDYCTTPVIVNGKLYSLSAQRCPRSQRDRACWRFVGVWNENTWPTQNRIICTHLYNCSSICV